MLLEGLARREDAVTAAVAAVAAVTAARRASAASLTCFSYDVQEQEFEGVSISNLLYRPVQEKKQIPSPTNAARNI